MEYPGILAPAITLFFNITLSDIISALSRIMTPIIALVVNATAYNIIFYSKKKKVTTILAWIVTSIAIIFSALILTQIFKQNVILAYSSAYLLSSSFILLCFYLYNNNFTQITFTYIAIWTLSSMFSTICLYISHLYFGFVGLQYQNMVRLMLFILIYSIIIPLLKYKFLRFIRKVLDMFNAKFSIFILFPIFSFVMFNVMFGPFDDKITQYKLFIMLMYISIIIFTYYFVFSTFEQIYEKSRIEEKLKASQVQQSLQKEYYVVLKKGIYETQMIRHDTRHHLITIQNLLKAKNITELNKYLNSLISKEENIELPIICENSSANAIISYYLEHAKSSNITTKVQISIPEDINIDTIDLNVIFGNCLENAIDACLKLSDKNLRFLNVKAAIINHYFVINITNSFNGIVNVQDDVIHSTKPNTQNHGIGLESVKAIVNKYKGKIDSDYTQNEFTTSIMMYNE